MYVIVWQFDIRADTAVEFERAYGIDGAWVRLFRRSAGYLGSSLLRDVGVASRYFTLDRWTSRRAYEAFQREHDVDYKDMDASLERLAVGEECLGTFVIS